MGQNFNMDQGLQIKSLIALILIVYCASAFYSWREIRKEITEIKDILNNMDVEEHYQIEIMEDYPDKRHLNA